jgi:hypothetical protein
MNDAASLGDASKLSEHAGALTSMISEAEEKAKTPEEKEQIKILKQNLDILKNNPKDQAALAKVKEGMVAIQTVLTGVPQELAKYIVARQQLASSKEDTDRIALQHFNESAQQLASIATKFQEAVNKFLMAAENSAKARTLQMRATYHQSKADVAAWTGKASGADTMQSYQHNMNSIREQLKINAKQQ